MGRKIDMKKIEDITRCQVTFSKRRSSVMKKANEIAVCCDVDIAFVAFSPSGRISKFCNQRRIEDVLRRYVDLPAEKRLRMGFVFDDLGEQSSKQCSVEKLRKLEHIKESRDYEVGQEKEPSLHQLSWCERNLNHSLEEVIARKNALADKASTMSNKHSNFQDSNQWDQMELEIGAGIPFPSNFKEIEQIPTIGINPFTGHNPMQLDHPWISPYSTRIRGNILQDLPFDQAKYITNEQIATSNTCNFPILDSPYIFPPKKLLTSDAQIPSTHFPIEESSMVDPWNNTSSQSSCNIRGPRVELPRSLSHGMGKGLQCSSLHLNNMDGQEIGKTRIDKVFDENCSRIFNCDETQPQAPYYVHRQEEVCQGTEFDNFLLESGCHVDDTWMPHHHRPSEVDFPAKMGPKSDHVRKFVDTLGDGMVSTSEVHKSSLWELEDLLLDRNFNFQDLL
ncbi:hypothetical protein OROMI_019224 [Orobanche minor]